MSADAGTPISHVSDTALWVAIYRAMESERPDAIFKDPYARRMGGERGEAIVQHMPSGKAMAWPMIVRTAVMDEIILRTVAQGARSVLNLAAGLDTRAFRLRLPPALRWFDVDFPDMVAYRREHLDGVAPACVHEHVAADLVDADARRAVFAKAAAQGPVLIVAEGLLIYLSEAEVSGLARALHDQTSLRWWLIDIASPRLLAMLAKGWGVRLAAGGAPMKFAPAAGTAFFAPLGWKEIEFHSSWTESIRLKRTMRLAWLWQIVARLQSKQKQEEGKRMAGIALLERT